MTDALKDLVQKAKALTPEERARLAQTMLESLREAPIAEIEGAWAAEIQQRVAEYDRGDVKTISAEDVFAEARQLAK